MLAYRKSEHPTFIELRPDKNPIGSVILLHGLGANGSDFVSIIPELQLPADLPLRFIFPHAPKMPVTINNGYIMPAWFDIYSFDINQTIDHAGIAKSNQLLTTFIQEENKLGIPTSHIVLAGFSQGAVIALTTALRYPEKLRGTVALSGYLPDAANILKEASPANQALPVFIGHGTEDTLVSSVLGEKTAVILKKHGYLVDWHSYPIAHSVSLAEIQDIKKWLHHIFQK